MAASLVTMVARGSSSWDDGPGIASQSRALRSRLTALGEEDATAFAQVLVTMRDRSGTPEQRDFALGLALLRAAEVPLRIAEAAADVAELAAAAAAAGSPHLQPDATAAAALAEAATQAATHLVEINLAIVPGDRHSERAALLASAAAAARARALGATMSERMMPAWSLTAEAAGSIGIPAEWPDRVTRDWAIGGATGEGVDVCILDSGVDGDHPLVGGLESAVAVTLDGEVTTIEPDTIGDVCGHGTACAGIVRSLAPACRIHSVRVLGEGNTGSAELILGGLRHAIEQRFEVINLSLSTTKRKFAELLHELADDAYFGGTVLVASAHNMPVESYPWRFSSVISVGSHEGDDSLEWYANPNPPVEFFARGVDLDVAWYGGSTLRATGNSFAAPHIAGLSALVLSKHPGLTPFQLKSVLYLTASNAGGST